MKFIAALVAITWLSACSSIPNAHLSSRPDSVILADSVTAFEFMDREYRKTMHVLPPGKYSPVLETGSAVYYLGDGAPVKTTWPNWQKKRGAERVRQGGLMLKKSNGLWFTFTLGGPKDMSDDGMPPIGELLADKIQGLHVNPAALVGRTDSHGRLVAVETSREVSFYGRAENIEKVQLIGATPFK